jgi:dTDP-4-amino-4,6-dideoxygalactose transaminase
MMAKADWILSERRRLASCYDKLLTGLPLTLVIPPTGQKPSYYKYMAKLPQGVNRDIVKKRLRQEYDVSLAGEVYATPGHLQPIWTNHPEYLAGKIEPLLQAEECAARQICLPLWPGLTLEQQQYVVFSLEKVLNSL